MNAARDLTVGYWNMSTSDSLRPSAARSLLLACTISSEFAPMSKKLSSVPIGLCPSSCSKTAAIAVSSSFTGRVTVAALR